jgi:hypothetical protein
MTDKHMVDDVADFVVDATLTDIGAEPLLTLKRNVLDSIACAVGALDGELIGPIRAHAEQFSGGSTATFIGGGRASVDQAAFFNAVLVRYPDLLDTFLTPGGLCHPADNFGAIFAVAEHVDASGADFLLALALAYEIQCRFSAQVPVMARGLNHALQLAMSAAAGSAKLLGQQHQNRCRDRRVDRRQRFTGGSARRTGLELERHLACYHRNAGGLRHHPRRPRNHRAQSPFRRTERAATTLRPRDRHADRRPIVDRCRADVSQAVLLAHPRAGHYRCDAGAARRAPDLRR